MPFRTDVERPCKACALAKMVCDHALPKCGRCTRLGIDCERQCHRIHNNLKTEEQTAVLRAFYAHTPHPTKQQFEQLSRETSLGLSTVKTWFYNLHAEERQRASWKTWYEANVVISMPLLALAIAYVIRVERIVLVPRHKVVWPMATHKTTAAVAALFLLTCGFAWVIAWSLSLYTMQSQWPKKYNRERSGKNIFGESRYVIKERHARQQQEAVLAFFLWTWANVVFWSVMDPMPSASSP